MNQKALSEVANLCELKSKVLYILSQMVKLSAIVGLKDDLSTVIS